MPPFPTGQKTRLNPLTIGIWWPWERLSAQRPGPNSSFIGTPPHLFAVGQPDLLQPKKSHDAVERRMTLRRSLAASSSVRRQPNFYSSQQIPVDYGYVLLTVLQERTEPSGGLITGSTR